MSIAVNSLVWFHLELGFSKISDRPILTPFSNIESYLSLKNWYRIRYWLKEEFIYNWLLIDYLIGSFSIWFFPFLITKCNSLLVFLISFISRDCRKTSRLSFLKGSFEISIHEREEHVSVEGTRTKMLFWGFDLNNN